MIWYDARTYEPVAPGAKQDGGPPSIEGYDCWYCRTHTEVYYRERLGICRVCNSLVLIEG